jgi:hypothetical protein
MLSSLPRVSHTCAGVSCSSRSRYFAVHLSGRIGASAVAVWCSSSRAGAFRLCLCCSTRLGKLWPGAVGHARSSFGLRGSDDEFPSLHVREDVAPLCIRVSISSRSSDDSCMGIVWQEFGGFCNCKGSAKLRHYMVVVRSLLPAPRRSRLRTLGPSATEPDRDGVR